MVNQNQLHRHVGQLQLQSTDDATAVLAVQRDMVLEEVVERLSGHPYVLVTDESGQISGIVSADEICSRLESPNPFERKRWQEMPLSALMSVTFTQADQLPSVRTRPRVECVAVTEGERLFGLAVDDDIFLSWRRLESLLSVALSDPLTGLLNRLAYERRLAEEWDRATRTGASVGVVVVDLDSFKRINDTLGHPAGDAVLRGVGHELESSMRSYDVVARFGGDEFVALCLGCAAGDIAIPIQRIQRAIHEMDLQFEGHPVPVTASIGAAVRHGQFDASSPRELFSAADECLYHAKASPESAWKVELGDAHSGIPEPVRPIPHDDFRDRNPAVHSDLSCSLSTKLPSGDDR